MNSPFVGWARKTEEEHTKRGRAVGQMIVVLGLAVLSCDVSYLLPSQAVAPTMGPGQMETVIAGTAHAAQTQTAELLPPSATPSLTPTATRTPTVTPTSTPTFVFFLRSPVPPKTATPTGGSTSSGSGNYACSLVDQTPDDGTEFNQNASFDAVWKVQNTGTKTWQADDVDFEYVSGRKMHEQESYDLPKNVAPGESVSLIVDMNAPKLVGEYKTVWTLHTGSTFFCKVDLTIVVE